MRMLTPEYASPEQVRGEPVTTATDVYSLGVVLYGLLTGHRPYAAESTSIEHMSKAICHTQPQKPSTVVKQTEQVTASDGSHVSHLPQTISASRGVKTEKLSRQLSGDLDNIVLMALRKEPSRRYASVDQFAGDIRRHLEGLPVVARKDSFSYRAGKFVKRNKVVVTAAALILLTLIAGFVATVRQAHIAREQRARAEQRFNDVRQLANSLMFEIHDSIETLPGSTPARKLIVQNSLKYLDSLAKESSNDVSLQRELATAYSKIGKVQGGPATANLGDPAGALESWQKALAIRQVIAAAHPDNVDDQIALSASYRSIFFLFSSYFADTSRAMDSANHALAISERLQHLHPNNKDVIFELANAYGSMTMLMGGSGGGSVNLGQADKALEYALKSRELVKQLATADPANLKLQDWLSRLDFFVGSALLQTGDRGKAMEADKQSIQRLEHLLAHNDSARLRRSLTSAYGRLGEVLTMDDRFEEALAAFSKEAEVANLMVAADPQNIEFQVNQAAGMVNVGDGLIRTGQIQEGLGSLRKSVALLTALNQTHSTSQIQAVIAIAEEKIGHTLARTGDFSGALKNYAQARAINDQRLTANPKDVQAQLQVADIENEVGDTYLKQKKPDLAASQYQRALALVQAMSAADPKNLDVLYLEFKTYVGLAMLSSYRAKTEKHAGATQLGEACSWYDKSFEISHRITNMSKISPAGFDIPDQTQLSAQISRCN